MNTWSGDSGLPARLVGGFFFLLIRGSHVAIVIYAPSLVLSMLTGISLMACVLIIGIFTTFYTTLGGMKAVIWTDVMQFSILVMGVGMIFWLSLSRIPGGIHSFYAIASSAERFQMLNWSLDPSSLTSVWAMILGGGILVLSSMGTDQAYLQRYFTTRSLKEGRRSVLLDVVIVIPIIFLLYLLGTVLFVYYRFHPDRLAGLANPDQILPFFIVHELPSVLSGLVIASIFASSMAVMSASINSLTTVTTVDFYQRWIRHGDPNINVVVSGRVGTVIWGAAGTFGALLANRLGPLANSFNVISSFLAGPLLGMFLLGMLTRRAKGAATITAAVLGLLSVFLIAWKLHVSFFYFSLIGFTVTCFAGYSLSLIGPSPDPNSLVDLVVGIESGDHCSTKSGVQYTYPP